MKFTYCKSAFTAKGFSCGDYMVVCIKDERQYSAVAAFNTVEDAENDAVDRNARAIQLDVPARYTVCERKDGVAV